MRRLDELAFPAPVSAMKLDVEGFELSILRGARALLARDRRPLPNDVGAAGDLFLRVPAARSADAA